MSYLLAAVFALALTVKDYMFHDEFSAITLIGTGEN